MALFNCPECGKLYEGKEGGQLCAGCMQKEAGKLKVVKGYLAKNPMASAGDVSKATGIPVASIMAYVNSGALKIIINKKDKP